MKLTELLTFEKIIPNLSSGDKVGALKELVQSLSQSQEGLNTEGILKVILEREKLGSTGTGNGVAIPHGKVDFINELLLCFGRSEKGIEFDSIDGKPAHLFFLLIAPEDSIGVHLAALAKISNLLDNETTRQQLLQTEDAKKIFEIIQAFDKGQTSGG